MSGCLCIQQVGLMTLFGCISRESPFLTYLANDPVSLPIRKVQFFNLQ